MFKIFLKNSREFKAIEELIEESRVDFDFILNLVISSFIITIGLVVGQIPIVIGGMLIAPLLFPILSLGLSLATFNLKGIRRAFLGVVIASSIGIAASYFIANFLEGAEFRGQNILISLTPSFLGFVVAFLSGISAAYAWIKKDYSVILPGVAIVVALVPPLCAAGIALAVSDRQLFENFILVYFLNLIGIVLASFLVFLFAGISKVKKIEQVVLEKEEKVE